MKHGSNMAVMLAGVTALAVAGAWCDERPGVEIPVCQNAPALDGALNDSAWVAALTVTNFVVISADGFPPAANVTAKLMRDAEWLYVGFDIRHPKPDAIAPQAARRDERVQAEDCVKVAFDPGTDGKLWYHIRLSAGNVISDQRNSDTGFNAGWDLPLRSATRITDTGWQAEMALPFSLMLGVGDPARAAINLVAHIYTPLLDQQFVVVGSECTVAAWAPTPRAWWQHAAGFIPVKGLDLAAFKAPFLPMLENVAVGAYSLDDGKYAYAVSGKIRNFSSRAGTVTVRIHDLPAQGDPAEARVAVPVPAGQDAAWSLSVPVSAVVRRDVRVTMESDAGVMMGMLTVANPPALNLFAATLDRNYYTSESNARALCRIGLPASDLVGMRLSVRTEDGPALAETHTVLPETWLAFPMDKLAPGSHALRLELRRADGALVADARATMVKRAPQPGREWKIDRINRIFLNNGEPYFPFGVIDSAATAFHLKMIADLGFNTILQWEPGAVDEYVSLAQSNNLNVILTDHVYVKCDALTQLRDPGGLLPPADLELLNQRLAGASGGFIRMKGWLLTPPFAQLPQTTKTALFMEYYQNNLPYITEYVKKGMAYSNVMGWFIMDEPVLETGQAAAGQAFYKLLHEMDGYRPVYLNYSSGIPNTPDAVNWSDALGTDPYWVPGFGGAGTGRNSINFVANVVATTKQRADAVHGVTWTIPMLEYWSGCTKRALNGAEQKAQTYLALINGTKGILYFRYPIHSREMFDTMRELTAQMRELGPMCVLPELDQNITYAPGTLAPLQNRFTDIQARLVRHPAGGYVLLAVNTAYYPVDAAISITGLSKVSGKITRLFSDDVHAVDADGFKDRFAPMDTRAYRIPAGDYTAPVAVAVNMTAHPDLAIAETAYGRDGRVGMKNRLPNPSYEEAALQGWPDYHKKVWGERNTRDGMIGGAEQNWGASAEQPFHGRQCMALVTTNDTDKVITYTDLLVRNDRESEYVFSVYLRADRDDAKISLVIGPNSGRVEKQFVVGREWRRYHLPLRLPAGDTYSAIMVILRHNTGHVRAWADALQFEEGGTPTEFEP